MARHRFEEKDDRVRWGGPALVDNYVRGAREGGAHSVEAPHERAAHERIAGPHLVASSFPGGN